MKTNGSFFLNFAVLTALLFLVPTFVMSLNIENIIDTAEAIKFFERENELLRQRKRKENLAVYNYQTNITEENRQRMNAITLENSKANKQLAETIKRFKYDQIADPYLRRQAKILSNLGFEVLNEEDFTTLHNAINNMHTNYASTKVKSCFDAQQELGLEPDIQEILIRSKEPEELEYYWKEWYDKAGTAAKSDFQTYVRLCNKAATLNNFPSFAEYWIHFYEDDSFEKNVDAVYKAILPLYIELHGYVRYRLWQYYGEKIISPKGNIPMHLLGDIWGQQWSNIINLLIPYKNKPLVDVTNELLRNNFNIQNMFELGDEFFQSLGMRALPQTFWDLSVLEKPKDREIVAHASAWDLYGDSDVRIKMCTDVNSHYLYVVHHELGHIQYYLQYEQQPTVFRAAPNPGFHEAVGDVIGVAVTTPKHLHAIGLSGEGQLDEETRINKLFQMALNKIVFLPFAYAMDKYRYAIFRGEIEENSWNRVFWEMRSSLTGVEPPCPRGEKDFDPPAKYHLSANVEYMRYFAADIFQFQFLKALCLKAGQYEPGNPDKTLDNCDFYRDKEAGAAFMKFLSAGNSRHWKELLQEFTGDTEMDPSAILEYFAPLYDWLKEENKKLGIPLHWEMTKKIIPNIKVWRAF